MAIKITTFPYPTSPLDNYPHLLAWLQENAAEYFPGGIIGDDENNKITCYPVADDTNAKLTIPAGITTAAICRTKPILTDMTFYYGNSGSFAGAAVTDHGIVLKANANNGFAPTVFISKTTNGDTCMLGAFTGSANSATSYSFRVLDFEKTISVRTSFNSSVELIRKSLRFDNQAFTYGRTTLTPICFDTDSYAPDLFLTTFSQDPYNDGTLKIIELDGEKYLYDGLIALRG